MSIIVVKILRRMVTAGRYMETGQILFDRIHKGSYLHRDQGRTLCLVLCGL